MKSSRPEVCNIVSDVFNDKLNHWEELPAGLGLGLSWNILWTWSKPRIRMNHLLIWQKVNHYPDSKQLTRKDLLKKNIERYTNLILHGKKICHEFEIIPHTFILPHEYTSFVQVFTSIESTKKGNNNNSSHHHHHGLQNFWILKPIGMSRGRGISLVKDLSQITYSQQSIIQRYIERPLCLQGYKFDLRLYILVTSFKPLEAFIYKDGFARISTHTYSTDPNLTDDLFIHLTNSSIQHKNLDGINKQGPLANTEDDNTDTGGSKISLQGSYGLWSRLMEYQIDIEALWKSICILVLKSLVIVDDKMSNHPCCFEMFGYDVLIDQDLRPWLIEVNASPSLGRLNPLDKRVKEMMIHDIINILDPAPYDRVMIVKILEKKLNNITKNRFVFGRNDPDLEDELHDILGDYIPRKYGETPKVLGNYQMLCPNTKEYDDILKLKRRIIKS